MPRVSQLTVLAAPFVWWGMVLAISFLEAPLKFRAPGITLPLGLGIGRLVFRALNLAEVVLAGVLILAGAVSGLPVAGWVLLVVVCAVLSVQVLVVRPPLDARAARVVAGHRPPDSRLHLAYIGLEGAKAIALPVLGIVLLGAVLP